MLLNITSDNPNLGYILRKNPNSSMTIKKIREGRLFGWFDNHTSYNIYYQDLPHNKSFNKNDFNYLDISEVNPLVYVVGLKNLLNDTLFKKAEHDIGSKYIITIECIKLSLHSFEFIKNFFKDTLTYTSKLIDSNESNYNFYKLIFTKKNTTLIDLLDDIYLNICLSCSYKDLIGLSDSFTISLSNLFIDKKYDYITIRKFIDKLIFNKKTFNKINKILTEAYPDINHFNYSRLKNLRQNWWKDKLSKLPIIDLGCGEGANINLLSNNIYLVEKEEYLLKKAIRKAKYKNKNIIDSAANFSDLNIKEPVQVLMEEVIEHNTLKDCTFLLSNVLLNKYVKEVFITTPNRNFNSFYNISSYRHFDHKWEMTKEEVTNYFNELINQLNIKVSIVIEDIGDLIYKRELNQTVSPTIGIHLVKKEEE